MDVDQSKRFVLEELKNLNIYLSLDQYMRLKSLDNFKVAIIGDSHAKRMHYAGGFGNQYESDFIGRGGLTAFRFYTENWCDNVSNWQPDLAIIVIGSNDMGRHKNVLQEGSFFAHRIMKFFQELESSMVCFVLAQGEV